jgi:hypothetical protein
MEPRFPLTGADTSAAGFARRPADDMLPDSAAWREDRACCCPAPPVVRVIMLPTPERRHSIDLLLCGHHYRICRQALAAARARIEILPGKAEAAAVALLEAVHRNHAEVR